MIRNSSRAITLAIAAAFALAPAVSGCGAGQEPQTASPSRLTEGVNVATDSGVNLRNLFVLGPEPGQRLSAGTSAPVYASVINDSADNQADRLVAVGSPLFQQDAQIAGGGLNLPARQPVQLSGTQPTGQPGPTVVLRGLTKDLLGGESIELTLRFQRGGDLKVLVPVVPHADAYATYAPAATPTPSSSATPGTSTSPSSSASPTTSGSPSTPGASASPNASRSPSAVRHGSASPSAAAHG